MGKHRKHTTLQPTEALEHSFMLAMEYSKKRYGDTCLSTPLYVLVVTYFPMFCNHPAIVGLGLLGIDRVALLRNCESLIPKIKEAGDCTDEFDKVRREANNLAQDMGETYLDIGHLFLAAMRETEIFRSVDKSMIREYKAKCCKYEYPPKLIEEVMYVPCEVEGFEGKNTHIPTTLFASLITQVNYSGVDNPQIYMEQLKKAEAFLKERLAQLDSQIEHLQNAQKRTHKKPLP